MKRQREWMHVSLICLLLALGNGCVPKPWHSHADLNKVKIAEVCPLRQPQHAYPVHQSCEVTHVSQLPSLTDQTELVTDEQDTSPTEYGRNQAEDDQEQHEHAISQPVEILPPPPPDNDPKNKPTDSEYEDSDLTLDEVITSVRNHFPLLLAILQEQGITSGQLLAAQGAFDLYVRAADAGQVGTFDSHGVDLGIAQNLVWNGISYFAGYRHSLGDFPIYYGYRKTGDGGEFRFGLLIPLLANRPIDRRRATLRQAQIARAQADPVIGAQQIDFVRAASRAYWSWVAAGRRYQITRNVLRIAEERDQQLAEMVQRGAIPEFERIDNQRVIIERQSRLIASERAWQQASIGLSLYLRYPDGSPRLPHGNLLPERIPEPEPFDRTKMASDIELAFRYRPEL